MQKVLIFGTGKNLHSMMRNNQLSECEIVGFIDNDPQKWGGGKILGKPVYSPSAGIKLEYDIILISSSKFYQEIKSQLLEDFKVDKEKILDLETLLQNLAHKSRRLFVLHNFPFFFPTNHAISHEEKEIADDALIKRIIRAYQRSLAHFSNNVGDMWSGSLWSCKEEIHQALSDGNEAKVRDFLRNPTTNYLLWGFEDMALPHKNPSQEYIETYTREVYDSLLQFAVILGLVRVPNPETPMHNFKYEANNLLDYISEALGLELQFPNPYPGEVGIPTKCGIVSYRAVQALYQAYLISTLLGKNRASMRVMEIGAGLGRTAYFCRKLGIREYTIIDIPMSNVAQAYFLGRTLGGNSVCLEAEEMGDIKVHPTYLLDRTKQYDLILNVDSFTEMDDVSQQAYWEYIQKHADVFLSINHEANKRTVKEYYSNSTYKAERKLCPMRRGYVEETIRFK